MNDISKKEAILVVDDSASIRDMVSFTLDSAGYESHVSADGQEALEFAADHSVRAVVTDVNMPRMDGRTALTHLKDDPVLRRIPVVVLTTSKAEEDILRTYDLGVNSFISKPVTFDGLLKVVTALNRYWIEVVQLPSLVEYA